MNQIKNLSLIGIFMAFVVIALGAWTRLVDAGLGCPDLAWMLWLCILAK